MRVEKLLWIAAEFESLKVLIADSVAKSLLIVKTGASSEGFVENCFYDRFYLRYGGCGE